VAHGLHLDRRHLSQVSPLASSLSIAAPAPQAATGAQSSSRSPVATGFGALLDMLSGLLGNAQSTSGNSAGPIASTSLIETASTGATTIQLGGIDLGTALGGLLGSATTDDAPDTTDGSSLAALLDALIALGTDPAASPDGGKLLDRLDGALDSVLAALSPTGAMPGAEASAGAGEKTSSVLQPLASALQAAADALPDDSPIAPKLERLAEAVKAGGLDTAALARLGLTPDTSADLERLDKTLTALLGQQTHASQTTAPAQGDFARAQLAPPPLTDAARAESSTVPAATKSDDGGDAPRQDRPAVAVAPRTASPDERPSGSTNEGTKDAVKQAVSAADAGTDPLDPTSPSALPGSRPDGVPAQVLRTAAVQTYATSLAHVIPIVAVEIGRNAVQGTSRFQIRLDPAELGRIDVQLDMDRDGGTTARLTVERAETLDLLKRDQSALERALAQSGLDQSRTTLEFSLRQDSGSGQRASAGADTPPLGTKRAAEPTPPPQIYRTPVRPGGLDLFA